MPVTFGELTALADDHLRFAARHDLTTATEPELVAVTCAVAACTSRVADLVSTPEHRPRGIDPDPAWRLATATVADQLAHARQLQARITVGLSPRQPAFSTPIAAHLLSGRAALGASRYLLATHVDLTTSGPVDRTPQAALIDSALGRRQLTVVAATHVGHLAPIADRLATQLADVDPLRAQLLLATAGHLVTAVAAVRFVRTRLPEQRRTVGQVHAVEPLRRHPPQAAETPRQLLELALASADRLQLIAFRDLRAGGSAHHGASTLAAVASSMVTCFEAQERLLQRLRTAAPQANGDDVADHLDAIDAAVASARAGVDAWSRIRQQLTGFRGLPPSMSDRGVRFEAADLAFRLAALANDRRALSTPGVSSASPTLLIENRWMAETQHYLDGMERLRALGAQIAHDHARLAEILAAAGQLLIPTRALDDTNDVPRPWSLAPSQFLAHLKCAYGSIPEPSRGIRTGERNHCRESVMPPERFNRPDRSITGDQTVIHS